MYAFRLRLSLDQSVALGDAVERGRELRRRRASGSLRRRRERVMRSTIGMVFGLAGESMERE